MRNRKITLLDLGGVVFQSTGISNNEIDWTIISQLNDQYGARMDLGEDVFSDFLSEYNQLTKNSLEGELFLEKVFDTLEFNTALIDFLRKRSNIIIVSDNYRENIAYISKRYHFDEWSIRQVYSYDYQMHKSNPNFFKCLLDDLEDLQYEDLVFIDDSPLLMNKE
ncbi:MAG: hypothetical protein AAGG68_28235 [Bacteroidota bacterium]